MFIYDDCDDCDWGRTCCKYGNCPVRLFRVGWSKEERKGVGEDRGERSSFRERWLCARPCVLPVLSPGTPGVPISQVRKLSLGEACAWHSCRRELVRQPGFLPPGLLFQARGGGSPEGFHPCPFPPFSGLVLLHVAFWS